MSRPRPDDSNEQPQAKRAKMPEYDVLSKRKHVTLLEWPKDWIVEVIRFTDCKSKAMFSCTSKLSAEISHEVQETSAGCQSMMSVRPEVNECVKEATRSALSRLAPSPTLAFLFVSPSFKDEALSEALALLTSLLPPQCQLSGCHGMGLMGRDEETGRMHEVDQGARAISLLLLHSPEMNAKLTFIDVKSLAKQFNHRDPLSTVPVTQESKEWLSSAIGVKDVNATSSFILLTSPTHLVTPFLRCLHELVPHALITGALASGGKPKTIALFSRQPRQPVQYHTNGLVVLEVSRRPDRRTAPNALNVPPMTGFASRGCKACSNVYQIVSVAKSADTGLQGDIIERVRLARTLQDDDASTAMLDEQLIRRLTGNEPLSAQPLNSASRNEDTYVTLGLPTESADDAARMNVTLDMIDVVRQMIERQASHEEGDINGLFIGISDEVLSKDGRILCDILEVQAHGVKIDTSIIQQEEAITNHTNEPVSLVGKYMQFLQLDSRASCLDLANRVRTATRKNQLRQLIEQKARNSSKFANYASILPPRPIGGLLLSCAGRGQGFFQHPNIDSQIVEYQGGGLQIAGFASSGEIGPPARSLQVQRWLEEMNLAAESSFDQAASSITHNLRNDSTEHKQAHSRSERGDDDDAEPVTHVASDAFVLPPTSIVSPAVLQSFTAVVTIFASQY